MVIVEYRVPMPFSAAEYRIGQLYTIAKKSRLESGSAKNGGPSVKINANEPYSATPDKSPTLAEGSAGQYTNKTYYLANRIPDWMKRLLPDSAAKLKEEAWNAYPYTRNKFSVPLLDKLTLDIESQYLDGPPTLENVFGLAEDEVRERSIVMVDFANDTSRVKNSPCCATALLAPSGELASSESSANEVLTFEPLFRAALTKDWIQEYELAHAGLRFRRREQPRELDAGDELNKNLMTCYKLCRIRFPVWPLQSRVEQFIQQYCRDMIVEAHRQAWLWQDEWTGMNMEQIRQMEKETQSELVQALRSKNALD